MWRVIQRTIPPFLLLCGGAAAIIYGAKFREVPVSVVQRTPPPPPPGFPGGPPLEEPFRDPQFGGPPFGDPHTSYESEPALIREVTYGGVALVYPGESAPPEIRRTYTGDAPALCPT